MADRQYDKNVDLDDDKMKIELEFLQFDWSIQSFFGDTTGGGGPLNYKIGASKQGPRGNIVKIECDGNTLSRIDEKVKVSTHRVSYRVEQNITKCDRDKKQADRDEELAYRKSKDINDDKKWEKQFKLNKATDRKTDRWALFMLLLTALAIIVSIVRN